MSDAIRDGQEAERLLAHPLLVEAFDLIEKDIVEQWMNSPARDEEGRQKLWLMQGLLRRLKAQITSVVNEGKVVEATLKQSRASEIASYMSNR